MNTNTSSISDYLCVETLRWILSVARLCLVSVQLVVICLKNGKFEKAKDILTRLFPSGMMGKVCSSLCCTGSLTFHKQERRKAYLGVIVVLCPLQKAILMGLANQKVKSHELLEQSNFKKFKEDMVDFSVQLFPSSVPFLYKVRPSRTSATTLGTEGPLLVIHRKPF